VTKNEETPVPESNWKQKVVKKYKQAMKHVRRNEKKYVAGIVIGTAVVTFVVTRRVYAPHGVTGLGTAVRARNIGNVFVWIAPKPRALSYVVQCDQTKVVFRSQNYAAMMMKLPKEELSKHLNGGLSNVAGYTFTRLGIGA
jgi:hypothetical protein